MVEEANSCTIYLIGCKNLYKCHNVPIPSTPIKEKKKNSNPRFNLWNSVCKIIERVKIQIKNISNMKQSKQGWCLIEPKISLWWREYEASLAIGWNFIGELKDYIETIQFHQDTEGPFALVTESSTVLRKMTWVSSLKVWCGSMLVTGVRSITSFKCQEVMTHFAFSCIRNSFIIRRN
jgi:hypothetical protein